MFETRRKISDLTPDVEDRNAKHYPEIMARAKQVIRKHGRSAPSSAIAYSRSRSGKTIRVANRWPITKVGNNTIFVTESLSVVSAPSDEAEGTYLGKLREYILTLPREINPATILRNLRSLATKN